MPPLLDRLECNSDSIILIAIAQPEARNFCRFTWPWLSKAERQTLKTALERARKKRALLRNAKHDRHFAPERPDNIDEAAAEIGLSLTEGQHNAVISPDFNIGKGAYFMRSSKGLYR